MGKCTGSAETAGEIPKRFQVEQQHPRGLPSCFPNLYLAASAAAFKGMFIKTDLHCFMMKCYVLPIGPSKRCIIDLYCI